MHCWYYEDLSQYDLQLGKWIIVEQQLKSEHQDVDEIVKYDLYMAVELDYEKVAF